MRTKWVWQGVAMGKRLIGWFNNMPGVVLLGNSCAWRTLRLLICEKLTLCGSGHSHEKIGYILSGAITCFVVGVVISIPFNQWYTSAYVKGEEDIGLHLWLSILIIWPIFLGIGGWLGNYLYKKQMPSSTREKNIGDKST